MPTTWTERGGKGTGKGFTRSCTDRRVKRNGESESIQKINSSHTVRIIPIDGMSAPAPITFLFVQDSVARN